VLADAFGDALHPGFLAKIDREASGALQGLRVEP
jgi:hypothetical protein